MATPEIPSLSKENLVTIKSAEELKRILKIPELTEIGFNEPIEASKEQLLKLKQDYLNSGQKQETIKNFVLERKSSMLQKRKELGEKGVDGLKKVSGDLAQSINYEKEKMDDGVKEGQDAEKELKEKLANKVEEVKKVGGKTLENAPQNVKELGDKAKDAIEKGADSVKELGFMGLLEKMKEEGGVFGFFAGILLFLLELGGMKGKDEKIAGMKEKKIDTSNPEYNKTLTQTQDTIISYIEKGTGEKLDEETKNRLKGKLTPNTNGAVISAENFEKLIEKVKSGKSLGIEDLKDSGVILSIMKDPDFIKIKELLSQNINKKLFDFFKIKFEKSGVMFNTENEGKLKGIIKREFENTTLNKLVERTKDNGGEVHFDGLEGVESITGVGSLLPNIIFEAYKEDIIKAENLTIGIIESGKETISIGLKALDGQNIIPDLMGRINWDDFDQKLLDLPPEKKLLLERSFYSELGLVSSVLGTIGFYGTSSIVSLIEGGANTLEGKKFSTPPIDRLEKTLNIIGEGKGTWLKDIEGALSDTKKSYEIVEKLKNNSLDEITKQGLRQELSDIGKRFTDEKVGLMSSSNLSKITKNLNPLQTFHFTKSLEQLSQIAKTNEYLGVSIIKGTFNKETFQVKQFIESFKIRYLNGRAVLNITEGLEAKEFAKAMGSLAPEIVKGIFKVAPILVVGNSIWNSAKEQKGEWYETLIMLNGFVGGMQLFKDTEVNYTEEGLKIKNPESFAGGIAMVGMESVFFGKEVLGYFGKGQYIRAIPMATFNSFVRLPLDAIKGVGWASARGYELLKTARSFLEKSPKKGKVGIGVAILLAAVITTEYVSAGKVDKDKLENDGLIKDGQLNVQKLKEKWNTLDDNVKEEIISLQIISVLEKPLNGKGDKFNFKLENGIFKVKIDKELEKDKELIENLLEDVSRFLTDLNSNIKLEISYN